MAEDYEDDLIAEDDIVLAKEPKSSKPWLNQIMHAEKAFEYYQEKCDNIDKLLANLQRLAARGRDREFALFWANIEVLKPSIYARPPVPVVVPKFKDRRPLYRVSSELLERSTSVAFDIADVNSVMMLVRDDLAIINRGCAWVRYETKADSDTPTEKICLEFKDRKDFLHEPARIWAEVGWVGGASYLSRKDMRKRFRATSGDVYKNAVYLVQKEDKANGASDNKARAKVWEIWSKTENKVVWVTEGCDKLLDEGEPHLKLEGFFPAPKPAYATVQRRSLIPVPDMLQYKDQLEEINELTGRIHALSEAIKVKGFYPAGGGDVAESVEAAIKSLDDRVVLVPISNWAAFGSTGGDPIIWLPIQMIAETVTGLVALRRQIIEDVYQLSGVSDIQRGETDPNETLGAQQLKQMNGAVRIRDKQSELVRFARDLVRISAEIMAENFDDQTLLDMSQMEIPTDADIAKQVKPLEEQAKGINRQLAEAQRDPEIQAMVKQDPEKAQEVLQQAQGQVQQLMDQIEKLQGQPTVEKVMKFLRDNKTRPFVLDIETDSTIQPDEQAEKQARTEFVTALGGLLQQFTPLVSAQPAAAPFAAEVIKFALAPYRAGRELEGSIEEFAEQMTQQAQQPPPPDPEAMKAEAENTKTQTEAQTAQADNQVKVMTAQTQAQEKAYALQKQAADDAAAREQKAKEHQQGLDIAWMVAQTTDKAKNADIALKAIDLQIKKIELGKLVNTPVESGEAHKPPSESIAFKDLPPEGQAQMAAQAGITLSPQQMADHAEALDAKAAEQAKAKASQSKGPA